MGFGTHISTNMVESTYILADAWVWKLIPFYLQLNRHHSNCHWNKEISCFKYLRKTHTSQINKCQNRRNSWIEKKGNNNNKQTNAEMNKISVRINYGNESIWLTVWNFRRILLNEMKPHVSMNQWCASYFIA